MKQVEIFKTDVHGDLKAAFVLTLLDEYFPEFRTNFDMDDKDKILRIESIDKPIDGPQIEALLKNIDVNCKMFID